VSNPADIVKYGQTIDLMVLEGFMEKSRVAQSMKRLYPNPWEEVVLKLKLGDVVPAVITRVSRFGVFALLEEYGIEGLIHHTVLDTEEPLDNNKEIFQVNQLVKVVIIQLDPAKRRPGLSLVSWQFSPVGMFIATRRGRDIL
jgi:ribosomal protein S1